MVTKQQIVNKIQELANEYLGHGGSCFDNFISLKKSDLEDRLETAEQMIIVKRQAEVLREKHTKQEWAMVAIFSIHTSEEMKKDRQKLYDLLRLANDLWLKV